MRDKGRTGFLTVVLVSISLSAPSLAAGAAADGVKVVDVKKADAGDGVTLLKTDEFKVTGECVDNGSGDFEAETFLAARKNNLVYSAYGPETGVDPFDVDFDRADPPVNFTGGDASGVDPAIEAAEYYEFYAEGKGVPPLRGRVETTVHASADCGFSGIFTGTPGNGPLHTSKRTEVGLGETERIYSNKDFKVLGFCEDEGSGSFRADTFLEAKRGGTIYYLTEYDQFDTDFGPNDGQVDITPDFYDAAGTDPEFRADSFDNEFFAVGKEGDVLQARLGVGVHIDGASCTFSGIFTGPDSGPGFRVKNLMKVDKNDSKTMYENDDFKVTASCENNGGGDFTADTTLRAKKKHLLAYAYAGTPYFDVNFNPSDGPLDITDYDGDGTDPDFKSEDQYTDFFGEGKGGKVLNGRVASGVHIRGADCVFAGIFAG